MHYPNLAAFVADATRARRAAPPQQHAALIPLAGARLIPSAGLGHLEHEAHVVRLHLERREDGRELVLRAGRAAGSRRVGLQSSARLACASEGRARTSKRTSTTAPMTCEMAP